MKKILTRMLSIGLLLAPYAAQAGGPVSPTQQNNLTVAPVVSKSQENAEFPYTQYVCGLNQLAVSTVQQGESARVIYSVYEEIQTFNLGLTYMRFYADEKGLKAYIHLIDAMAQNAPKKGFWERGENFNLRLSYYLKRHIVGLAEYTKKACGS